MASKPIRDSPSLGRVAEKGGQPTVAAKSPTVIARFAHGVLRRLASGAALTQFACECFDTLTEFATFGWHSARHILCVLLLLLLSLFSPHSFEQVDHATEV